MNKGYRLVGMLITSIWLCSQIYFINKLILDFQSLYRDSWWAEVVSLMAFSVQLLLGGFAYDILKKLSNNNVDWVQILVSAGNFLLFFVGMMCCLFVAFNNALPIYIRWICLIAFVLFNIPIVKAYMLFLKKVNEGIKV